MLPASLSGRPFSIEPTTERRRPAELPAAIVSFGGVGATRLCATSRRGRHDHLSVVLDNVSPADTFDITAHEAESIGSSRGVLMRFFAL